MKLSALGKTLAPTRVSAALASHTPTIVSRQRASSLNAVAIGIRLGRIRMMMQMVDSVKQVGFSRQSIAAMEAVSRTMLERIVTPSVESIGGLPVAATDPRSVIMSQNMDALKPVVVEDVKASCLSLLERLCSDVKRTATVGSQINKLTTGFATQGFGMFASTLNTDILPLYTAEGMKTLLDGALFGTNIINNAEELLAVFKENPTQEQLDAILNEIVSEPSLTSLGFETLESGEMLVDPSGISDVFKQSNTTLEAAGWTIDTTNAIFTKASDLVTLLKTISDSEATISAALRAVIAVISAMGNKRVVAMDNVKSVDTDEVFGQFEWVDGNPSGEDRIGWSVVLVDGKIKRAIETDTPYGVISSNVTSDIEVDDALAMRVVTCYQFLVNWFIITTTSLDEGVFLINYLEDVFAPSVAPVVEDTNNVPAAVE